MKQFHNLRGSQKCCSLVYPIKNIFYNHLTDSGEKWRMAKGFKELYRLKIYLKTSKPSLSKRLLAAPWS